MPITNIALDLFGIVILTIIFSSCLGEKIKNETRSPVFLVLISLVIGALIVDAAAHSCSGLPQYNILHLILTSFANLVSKIITVLFMYYLLKNCLGEGRFLIPTVVIFSFLAACTMASYILNIKYGFIFTINSKGYYSAGDFSLMANIFTLSAAVFIVIRTLLARSISLKKRFFLLTYPIFPLTGLIVDYIYVGWSSVYLGMTVSVVLMYTNIYLLKREVIAEQKTALMVSQINPHFMYNTLTTVAFLCDEDPERAKALTIEFSSFLRQNLNVMSDNKPIPFEQELRHVGCYLKIEKARFNERVKVVYNIQTKDFMLPALTVQPLVENAIKHGITKKREGGTVKITTYKTEKDYVIEIKDDGVGFNTEALPDNGRKHIGLENVESRLKQMCGGTLTVKSLEGVGTRVVVSIPQKRAKLPDETKNEGRGR